MKYNYKWYAVYLQRLKEISSFNRQECTYWGYLNLSYLRLLNGELTIMYSLWRSACLFRYIRFSQSNARPPWKTADSCLLLPICLWMHFLTALLPPSMPVSKRFSFRSHSLLDRRNLNIVTNILIFWIPKVFYSVTIIKTSILYNFYFIY